MLPQRRLHVSPGGLEFDVGEGAPERTEWAHLKGKPVHEVKESILADRPELLVQVVVDGAAVSADFRPDRVRIFVDKENKVVKIPRVG